MCRISETLPAFEMTVTREPPILLHHTIVYQFSSLTWEEQRKRKGSDMNRCNIKSNMSKCNMRQIRCGGARRDGGREGGGREEG